MVDDVVVGGWCCAGGIPLQLGGHADTAGSVDEIIGSLPFIFLVYDLRIFTPDSSASLLLCCIMADILPVVFSLCFVRH